MGSENAAKLAYSQAKPKDGPLNNRPPVILHHGLGMTKERWKKLMTPLANQTRRLVYAIDARNHGESESCDLFNFDVLAEDLANFMQSMDIPKATIVGHSMMGGAAVMKLALSKPEIVESVIVEDMPARDIDPISCNLFAALICEQNKCLKDASMSDLREEGVQQQLRECVYRTIPMIQDSDYEVLEKTIFPISRTEDGKFTLQMNTESVLQALMNPSSISEPYSGTFNKPALFIYGEESQMRVPDNEEEILNFFPKATLWGVQRAAHEVFGSQPKEFEHQLVAFLETLV